jgi:hypothetical protein
MIGEGFRSKVDILTPFGGSSLLFFVIPIDGFVFLVVVS